MTAFFFTKVGLGEAGLAAARVSAPIAIGHPTAPDQSLSAGSVLARPEICAPVKVTEVRLVMLTGPGPTDWLPRNRLALDDGRIHSAGEEGTPNNALLQAAPLL